MQHLHSVWSPQRHLRRGRAHPSHICTGTGLVPPHLHRDWAHPAYVCTALRGTDRDTQRACANDHTGKRARAHGDAAADHLAIGASVGIAGRASGCGQRDVSQQPQHRPACATKARLNAET